MQHTQKKAAPLRVVSVTKVGALVSLHLVDQLFLLPLPVEFLILITKELIRYIRIYLSGRD